MLEIGHFFRPPGTWHNGKTRQTNAYDPRKMLTEGPGSNLSAEHPTTAFRSIPTGNETDQILFPHLTQVVFCSF